MRKYAIVFIFCLASFSSSHSCRADTNVRAQMDRVYASFRELNVYLFNRDAFIAPKNDEKIKKLLKEISSGFSHIELMKSKRAKDPGFETTLKITTNLMNDAKNRFAEDNKGYALWRLRTAATNCITCHTRYHTGPNFTDTSAAMTEELTKLSPYQQGEFLLATRQFDRARTQLHAAVLSADSTELEKARALRSWLVIAVRVKPNPALAAKELRTLVEKTQLLSSERSTVGGWMQALQAWSEERPSSASPLSQAEALIRSGISADAIIAGEQDSVAILRATALIHHELESNSKLKPEERAHSLYLLGLAYNQLPLFFIDGLAETFLESCIREFPGSNDAKRAYKLYSQIITLAFTGSGGTHIPADEAGKLKELHNLSQGIPESPSRV